MSKRSFFYLCSLFIRVICHSNNLNCLFTSIHFFHSLFVRVELLAPLTVMRQPISRHVQALTLLRNLNIKLIEI